jgi:hypothetical protein
VVTKRSFAFYFERHGLQLQPLKPPAPVPSPPAAAPTPRQDTYRLEVRADPADSTIKVMNIVPKYHLGMLLEPGDYEASIIGSATWSP